MLGTIDVKPNDAAISRLKDSAGRGELVVIVGTGVSLGLTNGKNRSLSWKGLIEDGFSHCVTKGKISESQRDNWKGQLASNDIDDLLVSAEFMGRKLDAPGGDLYARWLENTFKDARPENEQMIRAIKALRSNDVPIATLNYDTIIEEVTGLPSINIREIGKVSAWMRRETPGILHLHGVWDVPETCVLGVRDYETTLGDEVRDLFQRNLSAFKRLLFIGCGDTFADPNFSAMVSWLRDRMKAAAPQHYALVNAGEMAARHTDPTWHGFVEPLCYGVSHGELPEFLLRHFPQSNPTAKKKRAARVKVPASTAKHAALLADYRSFLIKDCGQMTIEGVRADMDTAQRRFDLERLFVPLSVLPCQPDIPENDPQREQKIVKWQEKNKEPLPFGRMLEKHKRLALLALPGGGKTLLLKRLAVAYSDPTRRWNSEDVLPDLDVTPVLIRCREWREHIHRPIITILHNIAETTGQAALAGLGDALIPLLKAGRVLFLVDGLDEIHDDAGRTVFVENLEAFLRDYPDIRLVVTSREAGFSLVAPCLARFCARWRVAPLAENAITALCDYWHRLMVGTSPEALAEGCEVAQYLLRNESLRRLAENPLLLTMLLVVKHGAGRLPPDRVSLYERAVEVLLDTWNIKGHEALNLKEAVPQLACVAFQLMRAGKQTATEKELLALLEEAREKVPQIRRYAKDTPYAFLKRVELRSSLLVEAGHQMEGGRTVPFYQFRHLTFQEYLAAVAAVGGHYLDYQKDDTVLTPLAGHLNADEWKETIPMAAVLARKQAEPLMAALVHDGNHLRQGLEATTNHPGLKEWRTYPPKLPAAAARLVKCLVEEAEAAPETLTAALQVVVYFAHGCQSEENWQALCRGPYGEELLHQAWLLYAPMQWRAEAWVRNTFAVLAAYRRSNWQNIEGVQEINRLINDAESEKIARGLLTCAGLLWVGKYKVQAELLPLDGVERHLFSKDPAIFYAATWAWGLICRRRERSVISPRVLNQLLVLWTEYAELREGDLAAFALGAALGMPRQMWAPKLTEDQVRLVKQTVSRTIKKEKIIRERDSFIAGLVIAFHSKAVLHDEELAKIIYEARKINVGFRDSKRHIESRYSFIAMLRELGDSGVGYAEMLERSQARGGGVKD